MHTPEALSDILIFLAAAIVVVPLLLRFRVGLILGYLAAGVIIGPYALALVTITPGTSALAEFGVVFLLFMIGLELSVERLRALARNVFGLGTLQVLTTAVLIAAIAMSLGATGREAIVIGGGLALSSTAFVLQLLIERGERMTGYGQTSFAILLLQDLAVVPMLIVVRLLADTDTGLGQVALFSALQAIAAIAGIVIIGRLVLRPLYRLVAATGSAELFVATTLLVVLGTSWAVSLGGFSMALGAFMAGLLLAETEYRHQVEADIRPFRGILVGLFFIVVGMSIDLSLIASRWIDILLVVFGLVFGKSLLIGLLCLATRQGRETALRSGLLLSQGGEFGFVIFSAAMLTGVLAQETGQLLLAAISLSMAVTPGLHHLGARLSKIIDSGPAPNLAAIREETEDLSGHVVIVGFGRVGQTVAKALSLGGVRYVALDLHHRRVTKCHKDGLAVFYGNGADIGILNAVGTGRASAAVITTDQSASTDRAVKALRDSFPDLKIFVRARDLRHRQVLTQEGATSVVPEALEASIQLAGVVLRAMGTSVETIDTVEQEFRRDDYLALEEIEADP